MLIIIHYYCLCTQLRNKKIIMF
ncbi:hypothetical protein BOH78_5463 [Pichia kudriavzevii]|uniref:Uncharacterized protein n=1 Tax=Pichia kudriavzevii TaxID=4909 RepID=A0A1V2LBP7_PICKU|nr:hypothetical protein BOH78_5463 [Pichia kudriavzevii]